MSWYQPRRKITPYSQGQLWGESSVRFFVKPDNKEKHSDSTQNKKTGKQCKSLQQNTTKKTKQDQKKETRSKTLGVKKAPLKQKVTKDKIKVKTKAQPKKQQASEITSENFI